jgi:hypothetical protein
MLVSLWPENAMISSYVNNDAFALFTISIIIYSWVCGIEDNWSLKSCCLLGIGAGLCLISYYNAFIFLLLSAILWFYTILSKPENRKNLKPFAGRLAIMLAIALAIGGWFYIRNAMLYSGDILGMASQRAEGQLYAAPGYKPSDLDSFANQGKTLLDVVTDKPWLFSSFHSFIARFGYMDINAPNIVYVILISIISFGLAAVLIKALIGLKRKQFDPLLIACFCSLPMGVLLSAYFSYSVGFQAQGRYFLTVLIALCILAVSGLKYASLLIAQKTAEQKFIRIENTALNVITVGIIISHFLCVFAIFLRFRY